MNIEIQEFYPAKSQNKKCDLSGTLSIYLIDHDIDIRGVTVNRINGRYYFRLPTKIALDDKGNHLFEDGKKIRYPTVTFASYEKQQALMETIRIEGTKFIEQKLTETPPKTLKKKPVSRIWA